MSDLTAATAAVNALLGQYGLTRDQIVDLMSGVPDGGPNGDGLYPVTLDNGTVVYVPSPLLIKQSLLAAINAAQQGMASYASAAELPIDPTPAEGTQARVYADTTSTNNVVWKYVDGAWAIDSDFYSQLATIVQPLVDNASTASAAAQLIAANLDQFQQQFAGYDGDGPVYPIALDVDGRILLGFDADLQELVGYGLVTEAAVIPTVREDVLNPEGMASFIGEGVYPWFVDADGRILLGWDDNAKRVVAEGIESAAVIARAELEPLPTDQRPVLTDYNGLIVYGQSLGVGAKGVPVVSTTQPYANVTFNGGPRAYDGSDFDFSPLKPLVEDAGASPDGFPANSRGETICSGAANLAVTLAAVENGVDPASFVILASAPGHGGYPIADLVKGSSWYDAVLIPHLENAATLAGAGNYALHAVPWMQGEQDVANGTAQATYQAAMVQLRADIEADAQAAGANAGTTFMLSYQCSWSITTHPDIALAQLAVAKSDDKVFLTTPTYIFPNAGDLVHLANGATYKWAAGYFGRAYKTLVIDGLKPKWLDPISATRIGTEIRVRFDVPVLPLKIDTDALPDATDATTKALHGFVVTDDGTAVTISTAAIDGSDVVLTLAAEPSGEVAVRYAMDFLASGLTVQNGASGNLRDSAPETITVNGVDKPLWNWSPAFTLPVFTLGA